MSDGQKIRTMIVEDEPLILSRITSLLLSDDEIEIVDTCKDGLTAIESIEKFGPQLLFLDIQLPIYDGFKILEKIPPIALPEIVIVSAYEQYAIKAFEYEALDYILKPFDKSRFEKALQRAKNKVRTYKEHPRYVIAKRNNSSLIVRVEDIVWIQSKANYVDIHTEKETYSLRSTLMNLSQTLDPSIFKRIHRSHIINLKYVKELAHIYQGDYSISLVTGKVLISSAKYRNNVRSILLKN